MVMLSPGGMVPMFKVTVSPLNGAGLSTEPRPALAAAKLIRLALRPYEPGLRSAVGLNIAGLRSSSREESVFRCEADDSFVD